jgi:MFS family permease
MDDPAPRIWTGGFTRVVAAGLFYFLALGMVVPVLPLYITRQLGGSNLTVGIVVGVFALSAVVARPVAGRVGDRRGRRILCLVGAVLVAVSVGLYGVTAGVAALVVLRLVTGAGEGCFFTGASTLVADMAPPARRSQALSYFSVALFIGLGVGPVIGQAVYRGAGATTAFVVAGVTASVGAALSTQVPNPKVVHGAERPRHLLARKALGPATVLALGILGLTAFQAYVPLYVQQLHMGGPQWVFLTYAGMTLVTRVSGASLADRYGVTRVAPAATTALVIGLSTMALWATPLGLYIGAAVFGMGIALQYPALMTLVVSRAEPHERASMIGTFTAAFDVSQGAAGLLLGLVAVAAGYRATFGAAAALAIVGLVLLLTVVSREPGPPVTPQLAHEVLDDPEAWLPPGAD